MSPRGRIAAFLLLVTPLGAAGQPSPDAYSGFVSRVQEKLRELGFAAGPVNAREQSQSASPWANDWNFIAPAL